MSEIPPMKNPSKGGWKAAIFIICVEVAERFAYYGVAGNLFTYLTKVLGFTTATAAKNVNTWQGVSALFPVVGGFLADSYVGRFKTIVFSTTVYLLGLVILIISASTLIPPPLRKALFFTSLYTLSIGEGGHKPCVQTFAADQFDPTEEAAKSSFFNWWYVGIAFGATSAVLVVIYVQDYVGWSVGFGIPAAAVAAALLVFLAGSGRYRRERVVGSPWTRVAQVAVASVRKREVVVGETAARGVCVEDGGGVRPLARTSQFRFLDKATIIDDTDASSDKQNPWRLCTVSQVEEVKLLLQLIPIWISCLMFAVVISQLGTYFTKQGSTLHRSIAPKFEIPPASLQVITGLTVLTSVLLYERALVPFARTITGLQSGITILQRIGIGLTLSIVTMLVAAFVESKRVGVARENGLLDRPGSAIPMSVWWLVPQYVLIGLSEVFTIVGLQQLFYDQMPDGMRSVGAAAYLSVTGVGSLMSTALISIVQGISSRAGHAWLGNNINRSKLAYFYSVLAGLSFVNLCIYVCVARRFVYKKHDQVRY